MTALRGELWVMAAPGDYTGKPRPVLVIQDDRFSGTSSVTVLLCTSEAGQEQAPLLRIHVEPDETNGLQTPTDIMLDKIASVPRRRLASRIGVVSADVLSQVNRLLPVVLGLVP